MLLCKLHVLDLLFDFFGIIYFAYCFKQFVVVDSLLDQISHLLNFRKYCKFLFYMEGKFKFLFLNHHCYIHVHPLKFTIDLRVFNSFDFGCGLTLLMFLFHKFWNWQLATLLLARAFFCHLNGLSRREKHFTVGLLLSFPVDWYLKIQHLKKLLNFYLFETKFLKFQKIFQSFL